MEREHRAKLNKGETLTFKDITNDEAAEIRDKINFLRWMHQESTPVPQEEDEAFALMRSWIRYRRREMLDLTKKIIQERTMNTKIT